MKASRIFTFNWKSLFIVLTLLALVISIGLTFVPSFICRTKMTSACAHNPASHSRRLRPERDVLPTNVVPVNYDLTIKPDMVNFTFEGKVSIEYTTKMAHRHLFLIF